MRGPVGGLAAALIACLVAAPGLSAQAVRGGSPRGVPVPGQEVDGRCEGKGTAPTRIIHGDTIWVIRGPVARRDTLQLVVHGDSVTQIAPGPARAVTGMAAEQTVMMHAMCTRYLQLQRTVGAPHRADSADAPAVAPPAHAAASVDV